jgi:hypothetical protein
MFRVRYRVAIWRGTATMLAIAAIGVLPASAEGGKHHRHKPAGVKGVVLNSTCTGPCAEPPPQSPPYTGPVTVTVRRASDGTLIASRDTSDGQFRIRVKRGSYDVSAVPPNSPPCPPQQVCPAHGGGQPAALIASCLSGETKRVQVRRHRFTYIELHVQNVCIV